MIFDSTTISGVYLVKPEKINDKRGFFSRIFDHSEIQKFAPGFSVVQSSFSYNKTKGTIRGMHYQKSPHEEIKLVQCTKGSVFDVVIDLRADSKTYKKHLSFELNETNNELLLIPKGIAHGFQTLENNTMMTYHISTSFDTQSSRGVRFDDPSFSIEWKIPVTEISPKDTSYPDFK